MFKSLSKLALAAAFSFGASAFAAEAPAAAPAVKSAPASKAKAKAPKAMSFSGVVVSSDAIANTLIVKGAKGEETFAIAPTAKIVQGKKEMKIADVVKDRKVMVKYTEENGAKTATSVRVAAVSKKAAKAPAAAAAR